MPHNITIYTDGAASANPGPGGYGVVLMAGSHRKELSEGFRRTTNNRMELTGVIEALSALKECVLCQSHGILSRLNADICLIFLRFGFFRKILRRQLWPDFAGKRNIQFEGQLVSVVVLSLDGYAVTDTAVCQTVGGIIDKIALFCNIPKENAIPNQTAPILYEVPLMLEKAGLAKVVCKRLGLTDTDPDLTEWENMVQRAKRVEGTVHIALVGKYTALHDAYLSVVEALTHGGIENDVSVEIQWVDSEGVTDANAAQILGHADGIIVPGGFGDRGIEGMIASARYARENDVPYFGICLGMQMAVIEYARHVCALEGAHSSELDPSTKYPVIDIMPEQVAVTSKGGTMRLGAYPCVLSEDSRIRTIYGTDEISERHRHRYEFNNEYRDTLTGAGLRLSGLSPNGRLVEIVEVPDHPWYVGVQFHPELKSRPNHAHPLFRDFIRSAKEASRK